MTEKIHIMRKLMLMLAFVAISWGVTYGQETAEGKVKWYTIKEALELQKKEPRKIMIDVYTDWCGWCKRMDKDVYPDPKVQAELTKYFTAAKLNAESTEARTFNGGLITEQQMASHWGVTGYPTIIFLAPNGDVVQRLPGYVPVTEFPLVLRYVGSGAYKTHNDYREWKKTQPLG